MGAKIKLSFQIIEFQPKYEYEIKLLIGNVLKGVGVMPELEGPLEDDDLNGISETYSGKSRFWLAIENDKVIGTVAVLNLGENIAKLKCMFVLLDYHGLGVGQALFDKAVDFVTHEGFKKLILNTHTLEKRAHCFYEKNGFVKTSETKDVFEYELNL